MHAVIRTYSGTGARELFDLLEQRTSEVEGIMQSIDGFVSYLLVRTDSGGVSVSVFEDKGGADESVVKAREWVEANMSGTGLDAPRIGVAALNPHAGENGLFGDEEIRIIRPSVERVCASGIDCTGPLPSDTIFLRARTGQFDAVVIMYHDQGQIATKLLGFQKGVTVSAGMKTVYATPAHGTAFEIVGKGRADPGAMTAAFKMAAKLGAARRTNASD